MHKVHIQHELSTRIEQYKDSPHAAFNLPPSTHHWLICQNYSGPQRLLLQADGQEAEGNLLRPQEIIYIPPGTRTEWEFTGAPGSTHLLIPDQVLLEALPDPHFFSAIHDEGMLMGVVMPRLAQFINSFSERLSLEAKISSLALSELITETTSVLAQEFAVRHTISPRLSREICSLDSDKIRRLKEYMWDHLDQDISLAELAGAASLSPFHFSRLFKTKTGITPHQALLGLRVQKSRVLLSSKASLTEIAYRCGFSDQAHFTRVFKKHTSFTPSKFRKMTT